MPEEILIIFVMTILSVSALTLVKMILNHRKGRFESRSQSKESGSLTTSELEGMMRRAVEQSMTGLSGKIEDLELEVARLASIKPQLGAHDTSSRLELEDEVLDVEPVASRSKSRV